MRLLKCLLASLALGAGRMQHKIQSDTINLTINLAKLAHHNLSHLHMNKANQIHCRCM